MKNIAVRLAYDDRGAGRTLLLIHGHPFDRTMWRPQTTHFPDRGWRVVNPDLRGYGNSPVTPGAVGLDEHAADIGALLDELAVDRAVVCGLSMGGQIAMEFAHQYPERLAGLVLADTSPLPETPDGRTERRGVADRITAEGMAAYAEELLPRMLAQATVDERADVVRHVLDMMRSAPAPGAAAALRGRAERRNHVPTLRSLTVPALVVVGSEDSYTTVAEAQSTAEAIPDGRVAILDGAGHLPNLEAAQVFNDVLETFLADLAGWDR